MIGVKSSMNAAYSQVGATKLRLWRSRTVKHPKAIMRHEWKVDAFPRRQVKTNCQSFVYLSFVTRPIWNEFMIALLSCLCYWSDPVSSRQKEGPNSPVLNMFVIETFPNLSRKSGMIKRPNKPDIRPHTSIAIVEIT